MKKIEWLSAVVVCAGLVEAADIVKENNADELNVGTSWVNGSVPGNADIGVFDARLSSVFSFDIGDNLTWDGLRVLNPAAPVTINGTAKLTLDGGADPDLDMTAATQDITFNVPVGLASSAQNINITAGRTATFNGLLSATTLTKNGDGVLVVNADATVNGDTRFYGGTTILRGNTVFSGTSQDNFRLEGGTLVLDGGSFTNAARLATRGTGAHGGTLIVSNGTHRIPAGTGDSGACFIGVSGSGAGRLIVEGGSLMFNYLRMAINTKGPQAEPDEIIVNDGLLQSLGTSTGFIMAAPHAAGSSGSSNSGRNGRLVMNGGRFEIPNGPVRIGPDSGSGNHAGTAADIYLNGGTLAVRELLFGNDPVVPITVTFDGGTLEGTNTPVNAELVVNAPSFIVRRGGAFLSAASGRDFRVTANWVEAPDSPGGALVKTGPGRIAFSGTHDLSGPVIVSNGILAVGGARFTNLVVESGAGLSLSDGVVAPYTPPALRMGLGVAPARLELEIAESDNDCDRLIVPADAWFQRVAVDLVKLGTRDPIDREGDFVVVAFVGNLPATTAGFSWGNPVPGFTCTFVIDAVAKTVTARVRGAPVVSPYTWAKSSGGAWEDAANWTTPPVSGGAAVFGAALAAADTVTLDTPFTLGSLAFNNSAAYTLSGTGALTFGGTAPTLASTGAAHVIDLPVALDSPLAVSGNVKVSGTISGEGGITKYGDSTTLELTAENTYEGGTVLSSGNIAARPGATFGTGPIRLSAVMGTTNNRLRNIGNGELLITNDVLVTASGGCIDTLNGSVRLTGAFDFQAQDFNKAGQHELVFAGVTEEPGSNRLLHRNGSVRFASGSRFMIGGNNRDALHISMDTSTPRTMTVEEGAVVSFPGLMTGSGPSNTIYVNGGSLTFTGASESPLIRQVATSVGTDRIIVNAGEFNFLPNNTWLSLGVRGGLGEIIVNEGTVSIGQLALGVRSDTTFNSGSAAQAGHSSVVVNGGLLEITRVLNWMGDINPARTNAVTLNGGVLRLPPTFRSANPVPNLSRFVLQGGTLELAASTGYSGTSLDNHLAGLDELILTGSVTIDTLGNHSTITQTVTGDGTIIKTGAGSLTLSAPNASVGTATVDAGALCFASGAAVSDLVVAPGATFSLRGSTFDALSLSSLSLGEQARLDLDVSPQSADCDTIAIPDGAALPAVLIIGLYDSDADTTATAFGSAWPILTFTGTAPDVSQWRVAPECFGDWTISTDGHAVIVTLNVSDAFTDWANPNGGAWSHSSNWTPVPPATSGAATRFGPILLSNASITVDVPASVAALLFDSPFSYTLSGASLAFESVDVRRGTHTVATPLVADSGATATLASGATLRITGHLTGSGALAVRGGGTLVLDGTNHLDTVLDGATLAVPWGGSYDSALALGVGGGTFAGSAGQTLAVANPVNGDGALTKVGNGILDLGANAVYSGATAIRGGTLALAALPAGPITLGGATLAFTGTGSNDQPFTLESVNATGAVLWVDGSLALDGPLTSTTTPLLKNGPGTLALNGGALFSGAYNLRRGMTAEHVTILPDGSGAINGHDNGLTILAGTVVLGANGKTNTIGGSVFVGVNTSTNAETAGHLVIAGGYTSVGHYTSIGRSNGTIDSAPQGLASSVIVQDGIFDTVNLSLGAQEGLTALYTGRPELILNGGAVNIANTFYVGNTPGASASITINGGTLRHNGIASSLRLGQEGGEGQLIINAGTAEFLNDVIVGYNNDANATGVVVLAGGELICKRLYSYGEASFSRVLFNGGVFKPKGGGIDTSIDVMEIGEGPAIFDTSLWTGSSDFSLGMALTAAGEIDGGLVKTGAGVMLINAAQDYTGPTVVSNGTLSIGADGNLAGSALTVLSGAELRVGLNQTTKELVVAGLTLGVPGDPAPASLVLGFDYITLTSDRITVTGDFAAHAVTLTCLWRDRADENLVPNGTYPLITWTGSGPADTSAFTVANPAPGKDYSLAIAGNALVLTVGPDTSSTSGAFVWTASNGGDWSDSTKWNLAPGAGAPGIDIRFDMTIAEPATVNVNQDATLGNLWLNSDNAYTLGGSSTLTLQSDAVSQIHTEQGSHNVAVPLVLAGETHINTFTGAALTLSGPISGEGAIVKDHGGDLTLTSPVNTFTGGVSIANNSRVILSNGASMGAGPFSFKGAGGVLRTEGSQPVSAPGGLAATANGVLEITEGAPLTAGGLAIEATGSITKNGAGELVLACSADVPTDKASAFVLNNGTLRFAAGSDIRIGRDARDAVYLANNLGYGRTIAVDAGGRAVLSGVYTGNGTNTVTVNGELDLCGSGDALVLRVQDNNTPDHLIVNPGGLLTASGGGYVNIGVRGPACFLVNGGTASLGNLVLGFRDNFYQGFNGRWADVRVFNGGLLNVTDRFWWMADSNNTVRVNRLIVEDGGVARLPNSMAQHNTGWATFYLNNGTFKAAGQGLDVSQPGNYLAGLKYLAVGADGATFDSDGQDITIAQKVRYDQPTVLVKTGAGRVVLDKPLAWCGLVQVEAGILAAAPTSGVVRAALRSGLLARYASEAGPGVDSSGHGRHGNTWGSALTSTTDVDGGLALNFPAGSIVAVPMDAEMRGMDEYTVAMWVKRADVSGGGTASTFFTTRMSNSNDPYQFMLRTYNGKLRFMSTAAVNNSWGDNTHDSTLPVPANEWFHAACAVTATSLKLYVNGQPAGAWAKNNLKFCPPDRPIGGLGFGMGHPYLKTNPSAEFSGQVDDVQIYSRALSDDEIASIYTPTEILPAWRVANGATFQNTAAATVREISGEGYVSGEPITVAGIVSPGDGEVTSPSYGALFADDLTLADGATYRWEWSPAANDVLHTTRLTLGADVAVDMGRADGNLVNGSFRAVLATYDTLAGAPHLATWTLVNAGGRGFVAEFRAEHGEIVLEYQSTRGSLMFLK